MSPMVQLRWYCKCLAPEKRFRASYYFWKRSQVWIAPWSWHYPSSTFLSPDLNLLRCKRLVQVLSGMSYACASPVFHRNVPHPSSRRLPTSSHHLSLISQSPCIELHQASHVCQSYHQRRLHRLRQTLLPLYCFESSPPRFSSAASLISCIHCLLSFWVGQFLIYHRTKGHSHDSLRVLASLPSCWRPVLSSTASHAYRQLVHR